MPSGVILSCFHWRSHMVSSGLIAILLRREGFFSHTRSLLSYALLYYLFLHVVPTVMHITVFSYSFTYFSDGLELQSSQISLQFWRVVFQVNESLSNLQFQFSWSLGQNLGLGHRRLCFLAWLFQKSSIFKSLYLHKRYQITITSSSSILLT